MRQMFKKIITIVAFLLLTNTALAAGVNTNVGLESYTTKSGDNIIPIQSTYQSGSNARRWAKVWTTDLDVSGIFTFGGSMGSNLDMAGYDIENVDQIIGSSTVITIGNAGTTSHSLVADDDLYVSGKLEVDGELFVDGALVIAGTTSLSGNLNMQGNDILNVDDITGSSTQADLYATNPALINFGGFATTLNIGSTTGNVFFAGDIKVLGGDVTTDALTFNLLNGTTTTINLGGVATAVNIGAASGTTTIGDKLVVINNVLAGTGTAAIPSLSFWNNISTGFWNYSANTIGVSAGGATIGTIGSGSAMDFNFIRAFNNVTLALQGRMVDAANAIAVSSSPLVAFTTPGALIHGFNNTTTKAGVDLFGNFLGGNGSSTNPTFSWLGDPNTGFYWGAAGDIRVATGGVLSHRFVGTYFLTPAIRRISTGQLTIEGASTDGATAIGLQIGNENALVTAGAKIVSFYSDNLTTERAYVNYLGSFNAGAGTALLPAYSFVGDPNTGLWNATADTIGISLNGTNYYYFYAATMYAPTYGGTNTVNLRGDVADGATAVAVKSYSNNIFANATAKIHSFWNGPTAGGSEKAYIDLNGTVFANGTTSTLVPVYSSTSDTNTGIGFGAADNLNAIVNGATRVVWTSSYQVMFNIPLVESDTYSLRLAGRPTDGATAVANKFGAFNTLANPTAKIAAFYTDNWITEKASVDLNGNYLAGTGTVATPSFAFGTTTPSAGLFLASYGVMGLSSSGSQFGALGSTTSYINSINWGLGTTTPIHETDAWSAGTTTIRASSTNATRGGCLILKDTTNSTEYGVIVTGGVLGTTSSANCI
mgnify:CR=1 FL=1